MTLNKADICEFNSNCYDLFFTNTEKVVVISVSKKFQFC